MKPNKLFFLLASLLLCTTLFSSCLSVDRNIVINKDGSGNETLKITFSKVFYETMSSLTFLMDSSRVKGFMDSLYNDEVFINETKEKYISTPGIKLLDIYSQKNDDLSNSFIVKYEFDSVQKLSSSVLSKFDEGNKSDENSEKDDNNSDKSSDTEIIYSKQGENVLFSYNYMNKLKDENKTDNDSITERANTEVANMFKEGQITFEIQFPFDVISSNATTVNGNTLSWKYSLSESIASGNMKLEAIMKNE